MQVNLPWLSRRGGLAWGMAIMQRTCIPRHRAALIVRLGYINYDFN